MAYLIAEKGMTPAQVCAHVAGALPCPRCLDSDAGSVRAAPRFDWCLVRTTPLLADEYSLSQPLSAGTSGIEAHPPPRVTAAVESSHCQRDLPPLDVPEGAAGQRVGRGCDAGVGARWELRPQGHCTCGVCGRWSAPSATNGGHERQLCRRGRQLFSRRFWRRINGRSGRQQLGRPYRHIGRHAWV